MNSTLNKGTTTKKVTHGASVPTTKTDFLVDTFVSTFR